MENGKKDNRILLKQCRMLPWTRQDQLNEDVVLSTKEQMYGLFDQYGKSAVLGTLSSVWSFDKALSYFERLNYNRQDREIRTVATSYFRAYDGGIERVNSELMKIWVDMGYNVILFTEEAENELDYQYPETVKRIVIP